MRERAMGWEFTMRNSDGVRVQHEKKSDRVRVHHERKSDRVGVHNDKKQ